MRGGARRSRPEPLMAPSATARNLWPPDGKLCGSLFRFSDGAELQSELDAKMSVIYVSFGSRRAPLRRASRTRSPPASPRFGSQNRGVLPGPFPRPATHGMFSSTATNALSHPFVVTRVRQIRERHRGTRRQPSSPHKSLLSISLAPGPFLPLPFIARDGGG